MFIIAYFWDMPPFKHEENTHQPMYTNAHGAPNKLS